MGGAVCSLGKHKNKGFRMSIHDKKSHLTWARRAAMAIVGAAIVVSTASASQAACELTGKKGSDPFKPAVAGTLTVETSLPSPGWWNGDTPDTIKDGYEYCLAANIANRAGLDGVTVVNVAFDALVAGRTKDFDLALSSISVTDARKKVVDFSAPYFNSDIGVVVKKGTTYSSDTVKDLRIGVKQASTGASFADKNLHPAAVKVFPDDSSAITSLVAGQIDAFIHDTSIVLGHAANSHGKLEVVGQYHTGETYGAIYPKSSPNAATLDKIIADLKNDGTLDKLAKTYLTGVWGADPTAIPYLQP
ncbi:ABC transporter substrate-binding protein [Mesorhizobium kowhaii]|nr:ABC transporter substrate-binding protein [Mesorhizobium kowhaii]